MRIDILTIFPQMFDGWFSQSIMKRAQAKNLAEIHLHDIRDFSTDKHTRVDDYPFGGDAGMVMMAEPIVACIESLTNERNYEEIIYLTPDGEVFDQEIANELSLHNNIIFLCGHYKGIDQRVRDKWITKEISIGNFVISGGEMAAAICTDAIVRLIPGVLNDAGSALSDSFQNNLLSHPVYTRPAEFRGMKVPDVLLSGNQRLIEEWRYEQALNQTKLRRPDLLKNE